MLEGRGRPAARHRADRNLRRHAGHLPQVRTEEGDGDVVSRQRDRRRWRRPADGERGEQLRGAHGDLHRVRRNRSHGRQRRDELPARHPPAEQQHRRQVHGHEVNGQEDHGEEGRREEDQALG